MVLTVSDNPDAEQAEEILKDGQIDGQGIPQPTAEGLLDDRNPGAAQGRNRRLVMLESTGRRGPALTAHDKAHPLGSTTEHARDRIGMSTLQTNLLHGYPLCHDEEGHYVGGDPNSLVA